MTSHTGRTRDGQPLAFNHPPASDVAPWFTWFSATHGELPEGVQISCGMLNDNTCLRIMFGGRWTAQTRDGLKVFEPGEAGISLYFGPQSRILPITAEGNFKVITVHLAAGAATVLGNPPQAEVLDRILDFDAMVGHGHLSSRFDPNGQPHEWLATFEEELRRFLIKHATRHPDPLSMAFERQLLANPSFKLREFADRHNVAPRTLERTVLRDFGMSPRQVRRRARALDLASALLGVAMEEEEAALRLRYFDQSHQIREIRHFFDCTPGQLQSEQHPLLRLNLEVRQAHRVQALAMLPPDTIEPWRDPEAEPRD
ncbi:helix-turn-helix domain-containing protein [Erythrobacter mangrovi]|uniref:Helix-turn-helix domain-containing protein n=1 Tax=Erythrobacter mangrovi TaxID=2739433 RepID=A0A7D3XH37_9SPHN|nr:helix-turn-helix domain-containing protein [Erythrobacter mangrovi]QKG71013.1 helix-turn-helix domain-containing protein [Erythrobacter mangrovi]